MKASSTAPAVALLIGAAFWGVVWYPFRVLNAAGLDGLWSTLIVYGLALAIGAAVFHRELPSLFRLQPLAWLMGAAIGWSNLAYVMGVLQGEVMRVLLLFYLAPLWTVPLALVLLGERLDRWGFVVVALAIVGAAVMLWRPEIGVPWPESFSEWLGVAAGFLFALGNVLVRKLESMSDAAKSLMVWIGVTVAALAHLSASKLAGAAAFSVAASHWEIIAGVGATLVAMSYALQYGLSRLPANRAIVILLSELVVAAIAAYLLAGETLRAQDWIGGAFIVAAGIASGRVRAA
jgi:drug/metabolite transporter (DMT)-like permease